MKLLDLGPVSGPDLFLCYDEEDIQTARDRGVPYLVMTTGMTEDMVRKLYLLHVLEKLFPHINFREMWKVRDYKCEVVVDTKGGDDIGNDELLHAEHVVDDIVCYSLKERNFYNAGVEGDEVVDLTQYAGDKVANVEVEHLAALHMLPHFMDDLATNVLNNFEDLDWYDGYNKKLGCCIGDYEPTESARNLIIIDVSGSIPRGVSATMLTMAASLRERCNADLIVTGSTSMYWAYEDPLPNPNWIRGHIGCSNEREQFMDILQKHVLGKHWGNVISFGDEDSCGNLEHVPWNWADAAYKERIKEQNDKISKCKVNTAVDKVWHYHTYYDGCRTGYARWCAEVDPTVEEVYDTEWCKWLE